jgi:transcriptional antiterminator RfaH
MFMVLGWTMVDKFSTHNHHPGKYGELQVSPQMVVKTGSAPSAVTMLATVQSVIPKASDPEARWFVAHTKPRCEKKLYQHCGRAEVMATLPCYSSAHKYRGKTVVFQKPLFPGYVFLHMAPHGRTGMAQSDFVANLLEVADQATLEAQLQDIVLALASGLVVQLAPEIGTGARVRIKAGPLRGVEGFVEDRRGHDTILLRLDFISQAAAVCVGAESLELV